MVRRLHRDQILARKVSSWLGVDTRCQGAMLLWLTCLGNADAIQVRRGSDDGVASN